MNEADIKDSTEQAKQVAFDAVKGDLSADYNYKILTEQDDRQWVFTILPEGRVRGGGAEVTVSKEEMKVIDILYLQ